MNYWLYIDLTSGIDSTGFRISTPAQLRSYIDVQYGVGTRRPLHLLLCFSTIKPEELSEAAILADRTIELTKVGQDFYEISIFLKRRGAEGWLVTKGNLWEFYIDSVTSPNVAGEVAESWIGGMFPRLVFARIQSAQLLDSLDILQHIDKTNFGIHDYLLKSYPEGLTTKNWMKGQPYKRNELERLARLQKKILYAVHFEITSEEVRFVAKISRIGHFVYYGGSKNGFQTFYRIMVDSLTESAILHRKRFDEKQKRVIGDVVKLSPLEYSVSRRLEAKKDFRRLESAVAEERGYFSSLLSSGNPWLYLHIIDSGDGSSYDLYAFPDKLQLIPLDKVLVGQLGKTKFSS